MIIVGSAPPLALPPPWKALGTSTV